MAEASAWEPARATSDGTGNGRPTKLPAEGVRVDRAVERDQEDGVGVDARAEVREGGGDRGAVGRGDGLAKREVGGEHAGRVGELASARREDAVEHARPDPQLAR